ncbi:MAG: hypothetical protein ACON4X_02575 [Polaribacter sp.]
MSKLKERFGDINKEVFNKMNSLERQPIAKYNNMMRTIRKWESQIDAYKSDIDKLNSRIKSYEKKCKKLYDDNKHLEEEYDIKYNVSTNNKTLANGSKAIYWMINLKYRGMTKPIYLGSDDVVRKKIKEELGLKKRLKKEDVRTKIGFLCFDNLLDMVMKEKNLFDRKITFDDLV